MSDLRVLRRSSKSRDVWLLSDMSEGDDPTRVRVLDGALGRLYFFVDAKVALAQDGWEEVPDDDVPDVAALLDGIDQMPAEDPTLTLGSAAGRAVSTADA